MKTTGILLVLFSLVFFSCSENNINEDNSGTGLEFYLLADTSQHISGIIETEIRNLELTDEPFLTYRNIQYYNWDEHVFTVDSSASELILKICNEYASVQGIPFVVTVNSERIYIGAFWFLYSSIAPPVPYIEAPFGKTSNQRKFRINKQWYETNVDKRNDKKIYNSLNSYGLLNE